MEKRDIRVVSLNIQHGWNSHVAPRVYLAEKKIMKNLDSIVSLIRSYEADVVLLQEVDRTSPFSRKIDQLAYIQGKTGHRYSAFGASSEFHRKEELLYSAGCGIISQFPLSDIRNVKFEHTFPTPRKGFITASISPVPGISLTLASIHLVSFDILKRESRQFQIEHLAQTLSGNSSLVLGGDLNCSMKSKHMQALVSKLGVTSHRMDAHEKSLHTYPAVRPSRRIDWILTSPHLRITDYQTFPHRVSDHRAVGMTISL